MASVQAGHDHGIAWLTTWSLAGNRTDPESRSRGSTARTYYGDPEWRLYVPLRPENRLPAARRRPPPPPPPRAEQPSRASVQAQNRRP